MGSTAVPGSRTRTAIRSRTSRGKDTGQADNRGGKMEQGNGGVNRLNRFPGGQNSGFPVQLPHDGVENPVDEGIGAFGTIGLGQLDRFVD